MRSVNAAPVLAYIGIGSNVADPQAQVQRALHELGDLPATRLVRGSSFYATAPVGLLEQPDFVNAVAKIETTLLPHALLQGLLAIELRHGRVRTVKNGPRTLDLDILLYAALQIHDEGLTIPHPRLHERAFVLAPLLEVEPECEIPGLGRAQRFYEQTAQQGLKKIQP